MDVEYILEKYSQKEDRKHFREEKMCEYEKIMRGLVNIEDMKVNTE